MQTIQVNKDFVLTLNDGTTREFRKGRHEVDDVIADHWYVKAHSDSPGGPERKEEVPEPTNPGKAKGK